MNRYVALLRGINVGGNNIIKMTDLAASFTAQGFMNVSTYIQSGNVIFSAGELDQARLTGSIEEALSKTFHYQASVVLRSFKEMKEIVTDAPPGFGSDPTTYRYDVIFLKRPLSPDEAMRELKPREGVDQAYAGSGVLYFARLTSRASQSRLTRIISLPIYPRITVRNWNTTVRLLERLEAVNP